MGIGAQKCLLIPKVNKTCKIEKSEKCILEKQSFTKAYTSIYCPQKRQIILTPKIANLIVAITDDTCLSYI